MRTFSEVAGRDLVWQGDTGFTIPATGNFHFALHDGENPDPIANAHVTWQRQQSFDVTLESGDGTYLAHIDLTRNDRPAVVWKAGDDYSLAAMTVSFEFIIACGGPIDTHSGRRLLLEPTHQMGYEYAIFPQGGSRILTLSAALKGFGAGAEPGQQFVPPKWTTDLLSTALQGMARGAKSGTAGTPDPAADALSAVLEGIGHPGNPGHMSIAPESATDVELPALVTLAFAVSNEMVRLLHKPA